MEPEKLPDVVLFTDDRCSPCRATRDFLKQTGANLTIRRVLGDPAALAEMLSTGYKVPPVTVIDGVAVQGFRRDKLEELIFRDGLRGALG